MPLRPARNHLSGKFHDKARPQPSARPLIQLMLPAQRLRVEGLRPFRWRRAGQQKGKAEVRKFAGCRDPWSCARCRYRRISCSPCATPSSPRPPLYSIAIVVALGTSSEISPNRFWFSSLLMRVAPVTLPPGRLKLATRPSFTGSPPVWNTIGMVDVAALAAIAGLEVRVAAITSTRRRTSSAASAGSCSRR
jgi:hypothetical protein